MTPKNFLLNIIQCVSGQETVLNPSEEMEEISKQRGSKTCRLGVNDSEERGNTFKKSAFKDWEREKVVKKRVNKLVT